MNDYQSQINQSHLQNHGIGEGYVSTEPAIMFNSANQSEAMLPPSLQQQMLN